MSCPQNKPGLGRDLCSKHDYTKCHISGNTQESGNIPEFCYLCLQSRHLKSISSGFPVAERLFILFNPKIRPNDL